MLRRHIEIARLWGMMRRLFGYVIAFGVVWIFPIARKSLAEYWIQGFLDASGNHLARTVPCRFFHWIGLFTEV